jgi:hypothetical protein
VLDFIAVPVPVPRPRLVFLPILATAYAVSCAVFPDEAVLPATSNTDLGGGGSGEAAGTTADAGEPVTSMGGVAQTGGVAGLAGAGDAAAGGVIEPSAGATGEGGASGATCESPKQAVVVITEDTWIDADKQTSTHGEDQQLSVEAGATERRALLLVGLPSAVPGAWLIKGSLVLNLESNADKTFAERWLGLYVLSKPFIEGKATWLKVGNGNNEWASAGGDFGPLIAGAKLEAGRANGSLTFDVTKPLAEVYSTQPVPVGLIIIEVGGARPAPATLAFTSAEGDASKPTLVIEYCEP